MNVNDKLYCKEKIDCEKVEYETRIRQEILAYRDRCKDVGDIDRLNHTQKELNRLDKKFKIKIQ